MNRRAELGGMLEEYAQSDFYPLHMPGHKRNLKAAMQNPGGCLQNGREKAAVLRPDAAEALARAAALDITEIDGFDNLHEPEGILKRAMERAARLYGADQTFYSVNGSTVGLLTAISAAVPEGGRLIMARNCHRAVYHAVYLRRLSPVYLYPETVGEAGIADVITPGQVEEALKRNPDAAAVLITSPTYDGLTADIEQIAGIVHGYDIPLIVDAAHGAHYGFHPAFPDSPVHLGADLTVVSLHKTMPCMTQTALLHVKGNRVDQKRLRLFESMYQTSSPSYFLMAGIDACIAMTKEKGASLWDSFFDDREDFLKRTEKLQKLRIITEGRFYHTQAQDRERRMDPGKILIDTSGTDLDGKQLYDILLKQYHLQPEMAAGNYVTAIMTCCDRKEGWMRLAKALCEIDEGCRQNGNDGSRSTACGYPYLEAACSISDALDAPTRETALSGAAGQICGAFINLYPPGIPLAVPGERLSEELVERIKSCQRLKLPVCGLRGEAVTVLTQDRGRQESLPDAEPAVRK